MKQRLYHGVVDSIRKMAGFRVWIYAANAGFFVTLSVFPMLLLLMGLLRYAGLEANRLMHLLRGVVPEVLLPATESLIRSAWTHTSGKTVGLSALTALWSAGRGMYGLQTGLNAAYGVREDRGYLRTRFRSTGCTLIFLLILVLAGTVRILDGDVWGTKWRRLVLPVALTGMFAGLYRFLPNRTTRFRDTLPGAVLAAWGWLLFSGLYSGYVLRFVAYANIYGSVYAVALGMVWLYVCFSILFYGGVLNRMLEESRKNMSDS